MTKFVTEVIERSVASLKPYARNARTHSKKQIKQIASSIERFGFVNPVLIGDDGEIIAGHGRVEAAKQLGMETVPTLLLAHLSEKERRAYILADNKLAANAGAELAANAVSVNGVKVLSAMLDGVDSKALRDTVSQLRTTLGSLRAETFT